MKQISQQQWKETAEQCLFTGQLDAHLKVFLASQKAMYSDAQRWQFVYTTVHQWKRGPITSFDSMRLPSYFQGWNLHARLTTFSFLESCPYTLEQILYWAMLASWILLKEDGKGERTFDFPKSHFDWNLERVFRYPAEKCVWLHHQWFLEEIKEIYNRSKQVFLSYLEYPEDDNAPWVLGMEPDCHRFRSHYTFFKNQLQNPQIFRLNEFAPGEYAWYVIRDSASLYLLQLIDAV